MICAVADLPTPKSRKAGKVVVFKTFPVYMNVLEAESGSCAKPRAACCAATKALAVLMLKSLLKPAKGRESGSFGGLGVNAPAFKVQ
jgi:hypothetical protein